MNEKISKHRIHKELRRAIIMGHYRPGERVNVDSLAESYNTSVTPVRDALQMLSQEGLVTIKPRSGYYVTRITLKEINDLFDLRMILEIAAVERAVSRINQDQISELKSIHAGYTGDDDESYDRYTDENRRFHYLLAQASGNQELADVLGRLLDRLARFMVQRRAGKTMESTHTKIVEALENRDKESLRQALLNDIEDTRTAALEHILQTEAASWHLG
ncbi:MAG: GntR family transcriptional regulator [Anaerolineales bacterium]|jgi:DNA-binding GntR family transcriptional regulator